MLRRVVRYVRLLRLEDAVFAIPALFASLQLAGAGSPGPGTVTLMALALVAGGAAGLVLNRWIDRAIDARNPRTHDRLMASGQVRPVEAALLLALTLGPCLGLIWWISPQLMHLTPIFLALLIGYPFLKRWTWACNLFVGIQLSIIPLWTWLVFNDAFPAPQLLAYTGFILAYGIGIEVLYANADVESDRQHGIHSIPADFGRERARQVSLCAFIVALASLAGCIWLVGVAPASLAFIAALAGVFVLQLALGRAGRFEHASLLVNLIVSPLALAAVSLAGGGS